MHFIIELSGPFLIEVKGPNENSWMPFAESKNVARSRRIFFRAVGEFTVMGQHGHQIRLATIGADGKDVIYEFEIP